MLTWLRKFLPRHYLHPIAFAPFTWFDFGCGQDVMAIVYGRIGVLNCRFIRAEVLFK
jgi:hypothetical protein